jgi:hypothetical protein
VDAARSTGCQGTGATSSSSLTLVVNPVTATSVSNIYASASTFGGTTDLSAKVSPSGAPGSVDFFVNGSSAGAADYDSSTGVATLSNYSHGLNASATPYSVKAVFTPSSSSYLGSEATNASALTVNKANQTITFAALGNKTFGDADFQVNATGGGSGNPVIFTASGNCTITGANNDQVHITGAGSCTITASQAGNANYEAATSVSQSFNITYNFTGFASPVDNPRCSPRSQHRKGRSGDPVEVAAHGRQRQPRYEPLEHGREGVGG